jgi:hypothetical protein
VGVAAGVYNSLALRADGTVATWGRYFFTDKPQYSFVALPALAGLSNVVAVGGSMHSLALVGQVKPVIFQQPFSRTNSVGSTAAFSVAANGTAPLTCQWRKEGIGINGKTNTALSLVNITTNDAGNYDVVITNVAGSVTSSVAVLTVDRLAQTITFGALATKTNGDAPFTLTATASSGLPVSYTSSNPAVATVSGNTVTIEGVGSTTITACQAGNETYVAAAVPQILTVEPPVPPSIVAQPQSQMLPPGYHVTFTIVAAGSDPLRYQWLANGANILSATNTSFSLLSVSTNDAGGYRVIVTNSAGSITSAVAVLEVRELLRFQASGGVMGIVDGAFHMRLVGMSQTNSVLIEASTNLATWTPLYTNTIPTTLINYSDPITTNQTRRFYRAMQIP